MGLVQRLHEEREVTVVLVTHDSDIASRAQRVVELKDGAVADGRN
jgi:ABC-type lipoprotein export system ATPase subunit